MGAWAPTRAGAVLLVGELALAGRVCDRCGGVELRARLAGALASAELVQPRSSGGELLQGVLRNLRAALAELGRALVRR